jgi:hypothetical protein
MSSIVNFASPRTSTRMKLHTNPSAKPHGMNICIRDSMRKQQIGQLSTSPFCPPSEQNARCLQDKHAHDTLLTRGVTGSVGRLWCLSPVSSRGLMQRMMASEAELMQRVLASMPRLDAAAPDPPSMNVNRLVGLSRDPARERRDGCAHDKQGMSSMLLHLLELSSTCTIHT